MDSVTQLTGAENFYIIGDQADQYFIQSEEEHKVGGVLKESATELENADDITQLFLPKRIKIEDITEEESSVVQSSSETDNVIVMPDQFLLENGAIDAAMSITEAQNPAIIKGQTDENGMIVEHMDIRSPLNTLRELLEKRLGVSLVDCQFWLQDAQLLEPEKNLVDQCVQGEGIVQINCEIKYDEFGGKINVVDVLKPTEDFNEDQAKPEPSDECVRWVVDSKFKKEVERLNMPDDPHLWDKPHVKLWLLWAVRQFNLTGIKLSDWVMTGRELCSMTLKSFQQKVAKDPDDVFWTHLELLRKCHLVAVKQKERIEDMRKETSSSTKKFKGKNGKKVSRILGTTNIVNEGRSGTSNRSGNNGQIQLWQFLLELLTDKNHRDVIQWVSDDGEFRLTNPDIVAQLWGARKNKPTMNYEKLSRALRYYYDGDMIAKVPSKRFVYKFVCDLKQLLGYNASELNRLVTESAIKSGLTTTYCDFYEHMI